MGFIPPYRRFKAACPPGSDLTSLQLMIEPAVMDEAKRAVLAGDADKADLYGFNASHQPRIRSIAEAIHRELVNPSAGGALMADAMAQALCVELVRSAADGCQKTRQEKACLDEARLTRVLDYIEEHLGEEIGLADLAEVAGLSPHHFSRSFKEATGESPYRHLIRRRLARACEALSETTMPLAEIAYSLGFSSQPHFSNAFRSQFGTSPGAYRKQTQ